MRIGIILTNNMNEQTYEDWIDNPAFYWNGVHSGVLNSHGALVKTILPVAIFNLERQDSIDVPKTDFNPSGKLAVKFNGYGTEIYTYFVDSYNEPIWYNRTYGFRTDKFGSMIYDNNQTDRSFKNKITDDMNESLDMMVETILKAKRSFNLEGVGNPKYGIGFLDMLNLLYRQVDAVFGFGLNGRKDYIDPMFFMPDGRRRFTTNNIQTSLSTLSGKTGGRMQ